MVLLVGTSHVDFEGPAKLRDILTKQAPRRIGLEYPISYTVEGVAQEIEERKRAIRTRLTERLVEPIAEHFYHQIQGVIRYEPQSVVEYIANHPNTEVFFTDNRTNVDNWGERLLENAITQLEEVTSLEQVNGIVASARIVSSFIYMFARKKMESCPDELIEGHEVNQYMARMIQEHGVDIHIGGLAHVLGNNAIQTFLEIPYEIVGLDEYR